MRDTFVESHPFAKCAKEWGTLVSWQSEGNPKRDPLPVASEVDKMVATLDVQKEIPGN
jgi:hypothetical protein